MYYLSMHSPLHPGRLLYFFIYLGAAVEGMTGAGASLVATSLPVDPSAYKTGGTLISIALVLQAAVEAVFISMVALNASAGGTRSHVVSQCSSSLHNALWHFIICSHPMHFQSG